MVSPLLNHGSAGFILSQQPWQKSQRLFDACCAGAWRSRPQHPQEISFFIPGWLSPLKNDGVRSLGSQKFPVMFFCKDLFQITHLLVTFDVCFSLTIILGMVHPRLKLLRNKFQGSTTPEIMVQLLLPDGHVEKNPYDIPAFRKKPWKAEKSMSLCISEKRVFFWHTV